MTLALLVTCIVLVVLLVVVSVAYIQLLDQYADTHEKLSRANQWILDHVMQRPHL